MRKSLDIRNQGRKTKARKDFYLPLASQATLSYPLLILILTPDINACGRKAQVRLQIVHKCASYG